MDNLAKYDKAFIETFSIEKELNDLEYNKIEKWDHWTHALISELESEFAITFETDDVIDFSFTKGKDILKKYS